MNKVIITTKTPYRLALTGGSDLLPYVEKHGGEAFGVTINKYVTIKIQKRSDDRINLQYPDGQESVAMVEEIKHSIIRHALSSLGLSGGIDIISFSDVPPGTGLGSSGAFTVGLLNALYTLKGIPKTPQELAEEAADIEINKLKNPVGKQDQYMAAFGGLLHLFFEKDGTVKVNRININSITRKKLEQDIVLVFSGITRSASAALSITAKKFESSQTIFSDITDFRNVGNQMREQLIAGNLDYFSLNLKRLMTAKRKCFSGCTNDKLERFIDVGYQLGAVGAKIIGAGNGGFVYFYVPVINQEKFKVGISQAGGTVYPFSFTDIGTTVV